MITTAIKTKCLNSELYNTPEKYSQASSRTNNNESVSYLEDDLVTHEEFKEHFEKRLYERLGLKIKL